MVVAAAHCAPRLPGDSQEHHHDQQPTLDRRLARWEIKTEQYEQLRAALTGVPEPPAA